TRAFYRHFGSKDELILAIYKRDSLASCAKLRDRMAASKSARAALEVWIDETLALGFAASRARRIRPLAKEGLRLQAQFPREFAAHAYGHSALVGETWENAKVHPRDIKSLDDFRERAPFLDKDMVRRFRDERGDPFGGTLCVEPSQLTGVSSTSGTTGDPTL